PPLLDEEGNRSITAGSTFRRTASAYVLNFEKCRYGPMVMRGLWRIAGTDTQGCLHTGYAGGVEFARHVGKKEDVGGRRSKDSRNFTVTVRFIFRASRRIEISIQKFRQVAIPGAFEQELLSQYAA